MKQKRMILMLLAAGLAIAGGVRADEAQLLQEARGIPAKMVPKLLEVLQDEIDKSGHAGAISVCREKAPEMAKNLSAQLGWQIRRVSLKNRNPKAVPDAWERATLEDFERRLAAGEKPTGIDKGEIVEENGQKFYRYMKALPTQDLCLNCHGTPERLAPGVAEKLKELYPGDKAVGYSSAQIRGAITAKKPL
ncbi:MAG: Tll0287-like domain-containing protein [Pseudomonadota bacterium]